MPPAIAPFLVGLVVMPIARRVVKPLVRGVIKTSVGLALDVKRVAQEAGEEVHDLAAEVAAEMFADQSKAKDEPEADRPVVAAHVKAAGKARPASPQTT
jgi:hypothetical protein